MLVLRDDTFLLTALNFQTESLWIRWEESLINAPILGMKTKNRKVVRWIWLSKQNKIKIPKCSAWPAALPPTLSHEEPGPRPGPGEHRRMMFHLERSIQRLSTEILYSGHPNASFLSLSLESHFQIPSDLKFPRKILKSSPIIMISWETTKMDKKDSERTSKVSPSHCICF